MFVDYFSTVAGFSIINLRSILKITQKGCRLDSSTNLIILCPYIHVPALPLSRHRDCWRQAVLDKIVNFNKIRKMCVWRRNFSLRKAIIQHSAQDAWTYRLNNILKCIDSSKDGTFAIFKIICRSCTFIFLFSNHLSTLYMYALYQFVYFIILVVNDLNQNQENIEGYSRWNVKIRQGKFGKTGNNHWSITRSQQRRNQVSRRVSFSWWHITPVPNAPWKPFVSRLR